MKTKASKFEQEEGQSASHMPMPDLKWRHGLSPGAKNVTNVRHKIEPTVDSKQVQKVEIILKNLIETGFAENCDEELLIFDENGKITETLKGMTDQQQEH